MIVRNVRRLSGPGAGLIVGTGMGLGAPNCTTTCQMFPLPNPSTPHPHPLVKRICMPLFLTLLAKTQPCGKRRFFSVKQCATTILGANTCRIFL